MYCTQEDEMHVFPWSFILLEWTYIAYISDLIIKQCVQQQSSVSTLKSTPIVPTRR